MNVKSSKKAVGTHKIAEICQVTPPTVWQWIKEGKLPSFTTGGGHHRVWIQDLVKFLTAHNMPVPTEYASSGALTILIVDDEAAVRHVVARTAKTFFPDAQVHEAKDGFEAGHKVTLLRPTLVVLDIFLPGTDGIRVCEMIKGNTELRNTLVLSMSGNDPETSRTRVMNAGADGFLSKPFRTEALADEMKRLLSKSPTGDSR